MTKNIYVGNLSYETTADDLREVFSQYGTYLLPQAYPEGSPLHPAYGSGHATVAGLTSPPPRAFTYTPRSVETTMSWALEVPFRM